MADEPSHARTAADPRTVRLPRFLVPEPVGLGDVVKRVTSAVGVRLCGGCSQRAETLNRKLQFRSRT